MCPIAEREEMWTGISQVNLLAYVGDIHPREGGGE